MTFSVERSLARSELALDSLLASTTRLDVRGVPLGLVSHLGVLAAQRSSCILIVCPDVDLARSVTDDAKFWASLLEADAGAIAPEVFLFPNADITPFADAVPDRRATMDRLSTLHRLTTKSDRPLIVVTTLTAIGRCTPPRSALTTRSLRIEAEGELERDSFLKLLAEAGYARVPVVEDAGTFSVRGNLLDVYPPGDTHPLRIELDDYLVISMKRFDPETQRVIKDAPLATSALISPVRETLYGPEEIARARQRVRDLYEETNVPTSQIQSLVADIENGRLVLGIDGMLPAFYEHLETLLDYLPNGTRAIVFDPTAAVRTAEEELERAAADRAARIATGLPAFALDELYVGNDESIERLESLAPIVAHRLASIGTADDLASPSRRLEFPAETPPDVGGEDHLGLSSELKARRKSGGRNEALKPLAEKIEEWRNESLRVIVSARTATQADRIGALLRAQGIDPGLPTSTLPEPGQVALRVGALVNGFVLATSALAVISEVEILGGRTQARGARAEATKNKRKADAFIEDLRHLSPGDFIVHSEHGVGRFLGLERKSMPRTKLEELQGAPQVAIDVIVVEYTGGDKLFVPVTRLHQIEKFRGGEGSTPKLDRLGGQTFTRTKTRVAGAVKQMADELLQLYAEREARAREPLAKGDSSVAEFAATFAFEETPDQQRAIEEVLGDLESKQPMDRVVCGDVGFGKTEVALRAAFRVAMAGKQVAILCPTTVLAQQHYTTFRDRFALWPLRVEVLSRFVDKDTQTRVVNDAKDGKVDVLVGTHRILSKDIHFKDLGLLVVDEEQRFGVTHKERVKKLRGDVDVLTLSATPIPRTLQFAIGGLRDLSLIATAPVDRRSVRTIVTRWDDHLLTEAIQREIQRGGQTFFVHNRIDGLYERASHLKTLMPSVRFAVAHGQMGEAQLEQTMSDFVEGRYDVLCSTAIIESGLDIPRANTMIIDRADIFGLAQLYQLRGRVGRSKERAYCYLVAPPPSALTDEARARIEALQRFTELGSGFQVASLDLELRGAGDFLGAEQSGNVAAVGLDMFVHMLEEAVATLKGEPVRREVDTEISISLEHRLPDDYIEDMGVRLSLYKRFANAESDTEVTLLAEEMEERFGPPPPPARTYVRIMELRPPLRALRVLGCESVGDRVTLHLKEDTDLDPQKVGAAVAKPKSPWRLSPDMRLTRRFGPNEVQDLVERIERVLVELEPFKRSP